MQKRQIYIGLGVLALAAALALPLLAQPRFTGPLWGMGSGWMMGGPGVSQNTATVTSIDAAAAQAQEALAWSGGADLVIAEAMEFSNQFYVRVKERSTGLGAFELIVERNGFVHPEPGPNMMWNMKYGHMAGAGGMMGGGMMGGEGYGYGPGAPGSTTLPTARPIAKDRATQIAMQYLVQTFPGTAVEDETAFYGYFTFDIKRGGTPVGMLSVNAYTGQVWYHTWHGTFVVEKDF